MLSVILFLMLVGSFFKGMRRGFIVQLIQLTGFIIALFVAFLYYDDLASYIRLWVPYPQLPADSPFTMFVEAFDFEHVYYSGIAFAILFFVTKIAMRIVGSMLDFLGQLPLLKTVNRWLGGVLCCLEGYFMLFILLHVVALLPIEIVQNTLQGSFLAQFMINYTPFFSEWIKELWIKNEF